MDRVSISKLLVVVLLFSIISVGNCGEKVNADSNEKGIVGYYIAPYSSVKNQNKMGSCWMFAAIGAAESNLLKKTGQYETGGLVDNAIDLSEAQAVYTFYNFDVDKNNQIQTYSSNDVRWIHKEENEKYLGYRGGGLPIDAAMVLCADKGSALEEDNLFKSRDWPDNYSQMSAYEQTSVAESIRVEDVNEMAAVAKTQYGLNRFNMKSVEELPDVYSNNKEFNAEARRIWKEKIEENGAIYAGFYQERTETAPATTSNTDNSVLPDDEIEKDNNTNQEETAGKSAITPQKKTIDNRVNSLQEETVGEIETSCEQESSRILINKSGNQMAQSETTEDKRFKYYHAWRAGESDEDYEELRFRPNYWYFGTSGDAMTHVVSIIGWDDDYSKYNFAERLVNPDTNKIRDYDPRVAETKELKEIVETKNVDGKTKKVYKPDVRLDENGHIEKGYSPIYNSNEGNSNQNHFTYIVPKYEGSWIVKNSYGVSGKKGKKFDNGIEHISYADSTVRSAISLIVDENIDQILNNEKNYNSTLTHASLKGEAEKDEIKNRDVAEKFKPDKNLDLGRIGYWTDKENTYTRIRIYINDQDNSNPNSGEMIFDSSDMDSINGFDASNYVKIGEDNYIKDTLMGYHTIDFNEKQFIEKDSNISVVISQMIKSETGYDNAVVMEKGPYYSKAYLYNTNVGDTYVKQDDGSWKDVTEINELGNATIKLFGNETEIFNVAKYKSNDEYTYPKKDGHIFAGWYDDADYTTVHKENNGYAYAKFIDKNVLKIKGQIRGDYSAVRFISSLDHLDYKKAGFIISGTYGDYTIPEQKKEVSYVYKKITADSLKIEPNNFCDTSNYMFAYTVRKMTPLPDHKSTWHVTPYYITPDGTTVTGRTGNYSLPLK